MDIASPANHDFRRPVGAIPVACGDDLVERAAGRAGAGGLRTASPDGLP
ncbi:hypothetical protein ABZT03_06210 [Streptomyces sp. NPDC005574]